MNLESKNVHTILSVDQDNTKMSVYIIWTWLKNNNNAFKASRGIKIHVRDHTELT